VIRHTSQTTTTPDKAGSRATSIAHFSKLLAAWRHRCRLSRAEAGAILLCSARTIESWETGRTMPRGITLVAVMTLIAPRLVRECFGVSAEVVEAIRGLEGGAR
jgi:DNA-binding transcriptional regulator YiaG